MGIIRRSQLAMEAESVEGVSESLAAADADLEAESDTLDVRVDGALIERRVINSGLDNFATNIGKRSIEVSWEQKLKASGAAGTAPAWGKLLKSMGFSEAVSGGVSVTYKPDVVTPTSYTFALYEDGVRYQGNGGRGDGSLILRPGMPAVLRSRLMGAFDSFSTQSLLSPTYQTTVPPAVLSAAFSLDGYTLRATELDINFGNELELAEDFNEASGYFAAVIVDRSITGRLVTETVPTATKDWFALAASSTQGALTITIGATAGNIITITAPKVQWSLPTRQPIGKRSGISMDLRLNRNSAAGDGLVITCT